MIKLIHIMRTERDRLWRERGDDEETLKAYDEVIELLQSFFQRSEKLYTHMKHYKNTGVK